MEQARLDQCAACGAPVLAERRCPRCGAPVLYDVALATPLADDRARFAAAKVMATRAPGSGDFTRWRTRLAAGGVLLRGLGPEACRAALEALEEAGVEAVPVRPGARPAAAGAARPRPVLLLALLAALGLAAAGTAGVLAWRRAGRAAAPAPGVAPAATPASPAAGGPAPAPAAPPAQPGRSTQELAAAATPSVAVLSCGGRLGTGFFVQPDLLVTNAHVVCEEQAPIDVRLGDGRQLLGKRVAADPWIDYAVVQVPGAGARPLPVGDSTALSPGDRVVLIGNPSGLGFTVHEGKVSYVGRDLLGIAYVQLNADVNPGNSGGPLLDGQGRVVGVVSIKILDTDGIGLALPIEYARPAASLPALEGAAEARWRAELARVAEEDRREVADFHQRYTRPTLVEVEAGPGWLAGLVLVRQAGRPGDAPMVLDVVDGDRVLCSSSAGTVAEWSSTEEQLRKALRDRPEQRRLQWALRHQLASDLWVGVGQVELTGCPREVPASAALVLRGGEAAERPVRVPGNLAQLAEQAGAAQAARRQQQEQREARSEEAWRAEYRRLREIVARLQARRDELRRQLQGLEGGYVEQRRELARLEQDLTAARAALEELDRQASQQGIPRAWREETGAPG